MTKWSSSTLVLVVGFGAGLALAEPLRMASANAEGAPQVPVTTCVLHNIEKIQNVYGHDTFSPLTWLIEECRRNPTLRS